MMLTQLVHLTLGPEHGSVPMARHAVLSGLREHGLDRLAETVALLTSELATNAVRHARTPFTLLLDWDGQRARVEVADASADPPWLQPASLREPGGLGLTLIATMATCWGFESHADDGKVVWFELRAP